MFKKFKYIITNAGEGEHNQSNPLSKNNIEKFAEEATDFTELDPTVPSWVKNITEEQIAFWNNAAEEGHNHDDRYYTETESDNRYIQTELDPTVPQHVKDITATDVQEWVEGFNNNIISGSVTGDNNKTITLTKRDGSTLSIPFVDNEGIDTDDVLNTIDFDKDSGVFTAVTSEGVQISTNLDGRYSLLGHEHPEYENNNRIDTINIFYGDLSTPDEKGVAEYINSVGYEIADTDVLFVEVTRERLDAIKGVLHIFSFRKLSKVATKCIDAIRLLDGERQTIGFSGDIIDTQALLDFAQGGDVVFEWYDQINDELNATAINGVITELPYIVRNGVIERDSNGRVTNWFTDAQKRSEWDINMETYINPKYRDTSIFTVFDNNFKDQTTISLWSNNTSDSEPGDWWEATDRGYTSTDYAVGDLRRFVNNVEIYPETRQEYYTYITGGMKLLELRNWDWINFGSGQTALLKWAMINANGSYQPTATNRSEVIIIDNNATFNREGLVADMMQYYNL